MTRLKDNERQRSKRPPSRPAPGDEALSLAQAGERLGVHYMTVYRYVRSGSLEASKNGREWQILVEDLEAFDQRGRTSRPHGQNDLAVELQTRLVRADETGAWHLVQGALATGMTPAQVLVDGLSIALASIGDRWARGEATVGQEHLASATATRLVSRLGPRLARRGTPRAKVVIGAPPYDFHALPCAILRDLLRDRRLTAIDLGANVPSREWAGTVRNALDEPGAPLAAVGICATTGGHERHIRAVTRAIRSVTSVPILLGGHGVTSEAAAHDLGADHYSRSVVEAVLLLDHLAEGKQFAEPPSDRPYGPARGRDRRG